MKWKGILIIGILSSVLFVSRPVSAGEPAHYLPGLFPIRFAALPPPGPYYLQFNFDYHIDASGKASKVLTIPGVEPPVELNVSADVDVDYDMIVVAPTGIWMTPLKLLQADYGIAFMLPLAYVDMDLEGSLKVQETSSGRSISREFERDDSQFNLGDVFFTPFLLGWHWPRFDLMALYGFHAPTGKYNSGDIDNTGLGFFEHQFQVGGIGYLDEGKSLGLQVLGTYELNHEKIDQDVTVGDYVTLEYGVSKVFKGVFEVGLRGY
ncbi:MAG: SphA family protein, partial [Candidatus Bathyanammoxibius sp.]